MSQFTKASLTPLVGKRKGESFHVLINPAEYSLDKSVSLSARGVPGTTSEVVEFVNGDAETLAMEVVFDTYNTANGSTPEDVTDYTRPIADLLEVDGAVHASPTVRFRWGRFTFDSRIERVSQRFTMFLENGTPVRAKVSLTFKRFFALEDQERAMDKQSSDVAKSRVVRGRDSLWSIAAEEMGSPSLWRHIAEANGIDDPLAVRPGDLLLIPRLDR